MSTTEATTTHLPLPLYFAQILNTLLPIFNDDVSSSLATSQAKLGRALDDLYLVSRMITSLGIFSENEEVEELGDGELVFLATGWVLGEVEGRTGLGGYEERMACIRRSDVSERIIAEFNG